MNNSDNTFLVIMAGGIGSRFWPFSRNSKPKQFLDVLGTGKSLLRMTFDRYNQFIKKENIYIVTSEEYTQQVIDDLPELSKGQVLSEPFRRNTAPCVAYACYKIHQKSSEAVVIISPADHAVFNEKLFEEDILKGVEKASSGYKLITLGIKPSRPETGYGYIQFFDEGEKSIKKVKTFTEKPDMELAQKMVDSGEFLWNAGIFIWSTDSIIKAFEEHMPSISEVFKEGAPYFYTDEEKAFVNKAYSQCENISIDYAIMEKADNVFVILSDFGWSDIGTWNSLHAIREKDDQDNVIDANTLLYDCEKNFFIGPKDKLMVVQGLEGYLVSECDNVLLICEKDKEKEFRRFIADVKKKKGPEYL